MSGVKIAPGSSCRSLLRGLPAPQAGVHLSLLREAAGEERRAQPGRGAGPGPSRGSAALTCPRTPLTRPAHAHAHTHVCAHTDVEPGAVLAGLPEPPGTPRPQRTASRVPHALSRVLVASYLRHPPGGMRPTRPGVAAPPNEMTAGVHRGAGGPRGALGPVGELRPTPHGLWGSPWLPLSVVSWDRGDVGPH